MYVPQDYKEGLLKAWKTIQILVSSMHKDFEKQEITIHSYFYVQKPENYRFVLILKKITIRMQITQLSYYLTH